MTFRRVPSQLALAAPPMAFPTSFRAPRLPSPGQVWQLLCRTPALVFAMAVLGGGLTVASSVLVNGIRNANNTITVTGASTERITSDYVDWSLDVASSGSSQEASYQGLQPFVQRTLAFLKAEGVKPDEIDLAAVRSYKDEVRDPRTSELRSTNWTTRQTIHIGSWDVAKVQRMAGAIAELVGQGVPLTINEPAYTFTKLAEKRVDMLAKATRDARARAQAIAWEAGSRIGAITKADTGTFQITAPNSTEASNAGSYDTNTIEKDITAVMAVSFRVN